MARIHRWLAAVGLLSLICLCQSETAEASPSLQEVFDHYSKDGSTLNDNEVRDMIVGEYGDYVQHMGLELENELMDYYDVDRNKRLDISEMEKLVNLITRHHH